jgi:aspartate-semialdehyde dehydrogenase
MDRPAQPLLIGIVGGGTLIGREMRDVLAEARLPVRLKLIGADPSETGALTEQDGEPVVMTALDEENLGGARVALLAGSPASSRLAFEIISRAAHPPLLIDLTHAFEDHPRVRLRAPLLEPPDYQVPPDALNVIAHPAAIALALVYSRLARAFPFRRSIAHVFEPASERGQPGLDELKDQTVGLLSFKRWPRAVFDEQLGFNLLSRYGCDAPESLQKFESRIERDLATLLALAGDVPIPSVRLVQAPVFHGHSFSIWVEFEDNPGAPALEQALAASPHIDVRDSSLDAPTNVGFGGQSGLAVGAITVDANCPRACWLWAVADNLRLLADNALALLRPLVSEAAR